MLGNTSSEKTVTVEHYVLPKFSVDLSTERPYYLPGEHVRGALKANYFFGKPVAGGGVLLEGYTFDVQRVTQVSLQGATDPDGNFAFEFDLPTFIAGTDLEGGAGRFYLQAGVTDLAKHTEISNLSLPVSQNSLVIEAIPEGGQFRQGVENILYVLTSYPDGTPAETGLTLNFLDGSQPPLAAQTGPYGLAEVRFTPNTPYQQFRIDANDARGNFASHDFYFEGEYAEETVLLRPDQPVYRVGDTMHLTLQTSQPQGTAYLDIVREGQTVSTRSVPVTDGHAEVAVDLTPDLYGTLELHAYKILSWGGITRDTRLVVVDAASDLSVALAPDHEVYRPAIPPSRRSGHGRRRGGAAIGLVVDNLFASPSKPFSKPFARTGTPSAKYSCTAQRAAAHHRTAHCDPRRRGVGRAARALAAAASNSKPQANSHQDALPARAIATTSPNSGRATYVVIIPLAVMG
jgi:hypothetical protein